MVRYNPSTATQAITVTESLRPTILTINAPSTIEEEVPFTIDGRLSYTHPQTGEVGLPSQPIVITYNGTNIGTATTDADGFYSQPATIPIYGSYTLTSSFAGAQLEAGYLPSMARLNVNVGLLGSKEIAVLLLATISLLYFVFRK